MTRKLDAEIAVPAQCELAEGPVWDAARGLLRWVDILRGRVHALDPVSGAHSSFETGDQVGTAGLTRDGGLVLALSDRFARCDHDGQNLRRLDGFTVDGRCSGSTTASRTRGATSGRAPAAGGDRARRAPCISSARTARSPSCSADIGLSNGLDWSDDRRVFYYSDSHAGVDVFDTDPDTGALGTRRRFTEVSGGAARRPDARRRRRPLARRLGLAANCAATAGRPRRHGGQLPVTQVTSAAFGGADLSTLYITTARENFTPADLAAQPHAGRHLRLHPRRHRPPAILVRWLN